MNASLRVLFVVGSLLLPLSVTAQSLSPVLQVAAEPIQNLRDRRAEGAKPIQNLRDRRAEGAKPIQNLRDRRTEGERQVDKRRGERRQYIRRHRP